MKFFPAYAVGYRGKTLYPGKPGGYVIDRADARELKEHGTVVDDDPPKAPVAEPVRPIVVKEPVKPAEPVNKEPAKPAKKAPAKKKTAPRKKTEAK